jgi:acyl-CoA hydrolase
MNQVFEMFTKSDFVKGRFAYELFSKMSIADEHINNPNRVTYKYTVQPSDVNILGTLHGGATATIIDVLTSVSIAKVSMARTVSVNLTT